MINGLIFLGSDPAEIFDTLKFHVTVKCKGFSFDPSANNNRALRWAQRQQYEPMVTYLLRQPKVLLQFLASPLPTFDDLHRRMTEIDQSYLASSLGLSVRSILTSTSGLRHQCLLHLLHHRPLINLE